MKKAPLTEPQRAIRCRISSMKCASRPASIAERAPAVRSSRNVRLCSESRRRASSSCWLTRWRRYARREPGARRAAAALVERPLVAREARVLQVQAAVRGERGAGPPHPRRQHAVEHVDPARDHVEDPVGVADPHEVARPLRREERRRPLDRVHRLRPAARRPRARRARSRRSPSAVISATERSRSSRSAAALGDPEDELAVRARRLALPRRPDGRQAHGLLELRAGHAGRQGRRRGTSRCPSRASPRSPRRAPA